ncbi:hypothetical protein CVT23_01760 [Minwuia thermotolerans]|uniref:Uncharacterized protein n=1 Tax=Minwuia thermotolerans TaxID=2056226 RepID=A0A2M9G6T7_9PROT|nr:hypothetical protein CVT23_01760 [Minwuia thermotolerans]
MIYLPLRTTGPFFLRRFAGFLQLDAGKAGASSDASLRSFSLACAHDAMAAIRKEQSQGAFY